MKLDSTSVTIPNNEPMDVLWKDSPINPYANLTRLSQFAGAYAIATIDKATEVQMLLKEKEDNFFFFSLEQQLQQAKHDQQVEMQLGKLHQEFK